MGYKARMCMEQPLEWGLHEDRLLEPVLCKLSVRASTTLSTSNGGTTSCMRGISKATECTHAANELAILQAPP